MSASDRFTGEVNAAFGRGLIVGYEDGAFRPQAKITILLLTPKRPPS
ncbi:S-layer homology domain-containing protein [Cohnella sp. JJ-181]|nr:S-layer homology domain-containing protein [Cohnella sp. JJ-181]